MAAEKNRVRKSGPNISLAGGQSQSFQGISGFGANPVWAQSKWHRWLCIATGLLLCLATIGVQRAGAQAYVGSITGVVKDQSGAVVPGATVIATNISSGFTYPTKTNATGIYTLNNLPPATYSLAFSAPGFKQLSRPGIVLAVAQNVAVNVSMQVGATTQTVTVAGVSPLLETQNGSTGQTVNNRYILDLPLIGRMATDLAFLAPGVSSAANNTYGPANGLVNNFDSNGGRNMSAGVLLDGSNGTVPEQNTSILISIYNPPVDSIQEFKIMQNGFSAKYGFSGNTIMNVLMKSGTNQFHGDAYEFAQYVPWNAIDWFTNRAGQTYPLGRTNTFGGSFGGPIQKNKMFFFADYEGTRGSSAASYTNAVPSVAERNGDFSELCADNGGTFNAAGACSAAAGQLWDPMTSYYNNATGLRTMTGIIPFDNLATYQSPGTPLLAGTPYAVSATPGNLINPIGLKSISYFPLPNLAVGTPAYNRFDNWSAVGINGNRADRFDTKVDRQITDMTHLMGRYSEEWDLGTNPIPAWDSPMDPYLDFLNSTKRISTVLSLTHNFSPTLLVSGTYGFTRQFQHDPSTAAEFPNFSPVKTLGFPPYISTTSGFDLPPTYSIGGGYNTELGARPSTQYRYSLNTQDLAVNLDKMAGHHNLEFGGEMREFTTAFEQDGSANGDWSFDQTGTSQTALSGTGGDGMASLLVGFPQSGQYEIPLAALTHNYEYGAYIQDEWHITPNLTLAPGLRYDLYLPSVSSFNQQSWFNPAAVNPLTNDHPTLSSAAAADFSNAGIPVPNLSTLYGGLQFAGVSGSSRYPVNPVYTDFSPRFGLAYDYHGTVFRGSYGIFYASPNYTAHGTPFDIAGFEPYTFALTTMGNNGFTPWASLTNPFPAPDFSPTSSGGIILPSGSSLGLATNLGVGLQEPFIRGWNQVPSVQSWNLGLQHQFGSVLVGAEYVGTKGTHLLFGGAGGLSYLGPQIQSYSGAQIQALNTFVPNPFQGLISTPGCSICGPTIQAFQLARPFPEFSAASAIDPPWANSEYSSLQLKVEKRFSNGLQLLANYTWEKSIDDASVYGGNVTWIAGTAVTPQDPNDRRLEYSLSQYDVPQILNIAYVYQLPFGHGKHWGNNWNRVANTILGGWQTQGVWRFDDGQPLGFTSNSSVSLPTWGPQRPNFSGTITRNNGGETSMVAQYFGNPQVASEPAPYTLGNAPRVSNIFAPGTEDANLSLFKEIPFAKLGEAGRLELRLETFNALNHVQFCAPNTTVGQGSFGLVTCQANSPRQVQIAAKVYW